MTSAPPSARVVEVIADRGEAAPERYRYGSGCIVYGRTVLTAAHVVAGAAKVTVRDPYKRTYSATLDPRFLGDVSGPGPDLALVEIDDPALDLPPIGLAQVDRTGPTGEPVERCHAIGYPRFAETPSTITIRDTVDAIGVVPVLSRLATGLLSLQVSVSPRPLPPEEVSLGESEWSGMSGAPVIAAGSLLGVVIEHAPREGPSTITAVPLTALESDPAHPGWGPGVGDPTAWWSRLGVTGLEDLRRLPAHPERAAPAYRDTLRQFGKVLHQRMPQLLGRERELAEIAAFATGAAGYRWLVGGLFAGKTALLYEAVTVGMPAEVDVICYFLSRRASDADSNRFLAAVVPQLAYLCNENQLAADRDRFYTLWRQATDRAIKSDRQLLLVVDGLDEDLHPTGSPSVAHLLPAVEEHAHVLVASRPVPELPIDVPNGHPLKTTSPVQLEPFEQAHELADLARQEIHKMTHGPDDDVAVKVLGLLTAAAGPLSVGDLANLSNPQGAPSASDTRQVRRLVAERAARSLENVGSPGQPRYQFAHYSLLEYAQGSEDLGDPEYRTRIHRWAEEWRGAGWPTTAGVTGSTPRYLLDSYPSTMADDPDRLTALVSDAGWVDAAIQSVGVDRVLADVRQAAAADPSHRGVRALLATIVGQTHHLRQTQLLAQPGYVLRQLCLQAAELTEDRLSDDLRARLRSQAGPGLVPLWTTRRASRALSVELGRCDDSQLAVAVLPDGRVVSSGEYGWVLVWDPANPQAGPVELGDHEDSVGAIAVLQDGRVVTGGGDGRVLVWDPANHDAGSVELGRHNRRVSTVAVLQDGRVVTGGGDGRVLVWDPANHDAGSVELGRHNRHVSAVAVLQDGRVVTSGGDGRVLVLDPVNPDAGPVERSQEDDTGAVVVVLPDGRVVSGGEDGRVLVWDPANPDAGPVELGRQRYRAAAALPDGRVVSAIGHLLLVWDPANPDAGPNELGRHDHLVDAVAVLPDGRVVSGGEDGRVLVWDPARAEVEPKLHGHDDDLVRAVAVLPDGRVVTAGEWVLVWDSAGRRAEPVQLGRRVSSEVLAVALLPDGRVVTGSYSGRVLVWDPANPGAHPVELGRHRGGVLAVAVLPDWRVVTGGENRRVLIWDSGRPGAGPVELGRHDAMVEAVAVLLDGRVVSGGDDGRVLVWDPANPDADPVELRDRRGGGWVQAVAVLPDGRVVGAIGTTLLVWDPANPDAGPVELGRHNRNVSAVAALQDGRVVSCGGDRRVLVWDVTTRTEIAELRCGATTLAAARPAGGETSLVVAHASGGFSFWSIAGAT